MEIPYLRYAVLVRLELYAINCRFWHLWVCNGAVTHTQTHTEELLLSGMRWVQGCVFTSRMKKDRMIT